MPAQPPKVLKYSIQDAMGSLDLNLEDELTLFRNRRNSNSTPSPLPPETRKPEPREGSSMPQNAAFIEDVEPAIEHTPMDLEAEAARLLDVKLDDEFDEAEFDPHLPLSPNAPQSHEAPVSIEDEDIPPGAIVPSKALLPSENALAASNKLTTYTDPALDDYLESSEALLKHLDTPPAPQQQLDESNSLKWFGWAALATLVLSGLAAFLLQNVFQTPNPDPESPPAAATSPNPPETAPSDTPPPNTVNSSPPSTAPISPVVKPPNLEETEFQSVNPGNLAELPSPPPTSAASPTPSPAALPADALGRKFYVVMEYTDEASLKTAQESFPDAKLVNFTAGQRIQLQEFSDESSARSAAAEFQQKGFAVEILATAPQ